MILINKINLDDKSDCHYNNDWFQGKPISTFHCTAILPGSTFQPYLLQWILIPMQIASANTCKLIILTLCLPLLDDFPEYIQKLRLTQAEKSNRGLDVRIVRVAKKLGLHYLLPPPESAPPPRRS